MINGPYHLSLAPMEGVTHAPFRQAFEEMFPEWDALYTDFLRLPNVGHYRDLHIKEHFGVKLLEDPIHRQKTAFQILTTPSANTEYSVKQIADLGIHWLDLNLGCPSPTVNRHGGGSFLLEPTQIGHLQQLIARLRKSWHGKLSCKMRLGFHDDHLFLSILEMLQGEGVDLITVHGRTRDQHYRGKADWQKIAEAQKKFPHFIIAANGDIETPHDIDNCSHITSCSHMMVGRGALKKPWLAKIWKSESLKALPPDKLWRLQETYAHLFLNHYIKTMKEYDYRDDSILKKAKQLSRYLFGPFLAGEEITQLLRSSKLNDFQNSLIVFKKKNLKIYYE
jgi:tRNA-dihydrouridine synthase